MHGYADMESNTTKIMNNLLPHGVPIFTAGCPVHLDAYIQASGCLILCENGHLGCVYLGMPIFI